MEVIAKRLTLKIYTWLLTSIYVCIQSNSRNCYILRIMTSYILTVGKPTFRQDTGGRQPWVFLATHTNICFKNSFSVKIMYYYTSKG